MEKIKMPHPIAELDGDEMTHVLWGKIKEQLILPFVELNTEYYDLGLPNRERTADQVTRDAAEAIHRLHIGVKCATITPNLQRQEEYGLMIRHHYGAFVGIFARYGDAARVAFAERVCEGCHDVEELMVVK